jgi:hypothetical protein
LKTHFTSFLRLHVFRKLHTYFTSTMFTVVNIWNCSYINCKWYSHIYILWHIF